MMDYLGFFSHDTLSNVFEQMLLINLFVKKIFVPIFKMHYTEE